MPSPPGTATKDFRWPQRRRLLRRADFVAAYEQGMRRASRHFTVFAQARDGQGGAQAGDRGPARFGITASRKLGPAVVRNRIRRRTRELLRRLPASLGTGCNVVINPRPSVATDDLAALARELDSVLQLLFAAIRK